MTKIRFSSIFRVPIDARDEFAKLAQILADRVRDTEPTTEEYLWFCNARRTEWEVRETYPSSQAAMEHIKNMGAELDRILDISTLEWRIYGPIEGELAELAEHAGATVLNVEPGF